MAILIHESLQWRHHIVQLVWCGVLAPLDTFEPLFLIRGTIRAIATDSHLVLYTRVMLYSLVVTAFV